MTWRNGRKKPKICICSWFHCLRNVKLAIGAWLNGYELELICKPEGMALMQDMGFIHIYNNIRIFNNNSQFEAAAMKSDADIFWCHNEPDMMTEIVCDPAVKQGRMVIHDCHDLPTLHPGMEKLLAEQERIATLESDFVFVPTPPYVDMIEKKYDLVGKNKIKVVLSASPSIFFPDSDLPGSSNKQNHLGMLYCGQVNVPDMQSQLHYRNCLPLFSALTQMGIVSTIYNTTPSANLGIYTQAGALVMQTMRMFAAMHQYTRYDYGFVGSNVDCEEIQICFPNKLLDCMASGIPLICLNAKTAGEFIESNEIGLAVQGIANLAKVPWHDWGFWDKCRAKVREIRHEYTAEKEVRKAFDAIGI